MLTAFDIGGSAVKSARVDADGTTTPMRKAPTPLHSFEAFAAVIKKMITENPNISKGVAVSITGVVDAQSGITKCANVPCTDGRTLAKDLEEYLKLPVWVANDADCFALAEAQLGAARGHENVFGIILGTGVGGGVVLHGKLVAGAGGYSGEWGHGPICATTSPHWPNPIPRFACGCGQFGCVDTIGGARGIERLHAHLHGENFASTKIIQNWHAGDKNADISINVMIDFLSDPLAMVLNVLGSSIVPVGGGLSSVTKLIERLDAAVRPKMLRHSPQPLIVPGQCVIEPGLLGAAQLGLQMLRA